MIIEKDVCLNEVKKSEKGASMVEYALLAALIAVVALTAITFLGTQASTTFSRIGSEMENANTTPPAP